MKGYVNFRNNHKLEFKFEQDNVLLLVKPDENEKCGFDFVVFCFVSCPYNDDYDDLWGNDTEFNIWFEGTARYDGLRHIWFKGEDGDGYLNYMNPKTMSDVMLKIRELEEQYCSEHYDSRP